MNQTGASISVVSVYTKFEDIHVRQAKGRYTRWRWFFVWLTQAVFYGLPWLNWNGRQAVLFDLVARKFYLFGLVLFPQDFIFLAVLLIICAYSLFLFTTITGRVWCGFSCPQTVYSEIFIWIENKIEGSRSARIRLARQAMNADKLRKKISKHAIWAGIALWTGLSFVGYFTPIQVLSAEVRNGALGGWELFWILFYGAATYGNAGFMREQFCRYLCPYARFQGSMLDKDTLIVSYDKARGEPRGALGKAKADVAAKGACIDCLMCVQVCPTGIDIRNGLQHDCIGCAACIDACESVMDKIAAPRGLIRFTTENAMLHQWPLKKIRRNILRPRVLIYSLILLCMVGAFSFSLSTHTPLKMNVLRDRATMGRVVSSGAGTAVENVYRLHVMNSDELPHQYQIGVLGVAQIRLASAQYVSLQATESKTIPVTVQLPAGVGNKGANPIRFVLQATDDARLQISEKATFFVPRE